MEGARRRSRFRCRSWRRDEGNWGTRKTPPRFVARTMVATFATVGFILAAVFVVVTVAVRATVRSTVAERLDTGQRILSALEQRRGRELQTRVATLAENPTLKAAMDTYHQELRLEHGVQSRELLDTIERQVNNLVTRIHPDIVVVTDPTGAIVAVEGQEARGLAPGRRAPTAVHRCVGPVRRASRRGVSIRRRPARAPGRTEHRPRRAAARDGPGLRLRCRALLPVRSWHRDRFARRASSRARCRLRPRAR